MRGKGDESRAHVAPGFFQEDARPRTGGLPFAGDATAHLTGIERLSQYAWRFRYPGAPYSPEQTEAEEARHAAGQLLDAMAAQLDSQFGG
jgi:hypothetical protein